MPKKLFNILLLGVILFTILPAKQLGKLFEANSTTLNWDDTENIPEKKMAPELLYFYSHVHHNTKWEATSSLPKSSFGRFDARLPQNVSLEIIAPPPNLS